MRYKEWHGSLLVVAAIAVSWSLAGPIFAASTYWQLDPSTAGNWDDPNNWTAGVPGSSDLAYVDNGGTANMPTSFASASSISVGHTHPGYVHQSGGYAYAGVLMVARSNDVTGSYDLGGGTLNAPSEYVGFAGPGSLLQSDGLNTPRWLYVGYGLGSSGQYYLNGGSLSAEEQYVGSYASGRVTQSGGTNVVTTILSLGIDVGFRGTYELNAGRLDVQSGQISVGPGGSGVLTLNGGTAMAGQMSVRAGTVHVGKNAAVTIGQIQLANDASSLTVTRFELSATKSASIAASPVGTVTIGAAGTHTLNLQTGSYRPREGDRFTLMTGFSSISGTFDAITTNLTLGNAGFSGGVNTNSYRVTFTGLAAGDANGDHRVNTGDLAQTATSWMTSGKGWGNGEFTGDGVVGTGDLALMGTNWLWSLPTPAPDQPIPEPATLALLGTCGAALIRRNRWPL